MGGALINLRTVRTRVTLLLVGVMLVPALAVWVHTKIDVRSQDRVAQLAADTLTRAVPLADQPQALDDLAWSAGVRIRLFDSSGRLVHGSDRDYRDTMGQFTGHLLFGHRDWPTLFWHDGQQNDVHQTPWFQATLAEGRHAGCEEAFSAELLVCRSTVQTGFGVVEVTDSSRRALRALHDSQPQLLKLTLMVFPLGGLLGLCLAYWIVRPAERLVAALEDRRRRSSSEPLGWERPDEFGRIARAYDDVQVEIAARRGDYVQAVTDLSHELKNPVAALRMAGDQLDGEGDLPADRRARLARVVDTASTRLDGLVSQFLMLARAEAQVKQRAPVQVDVVGLLTGISDQYIDTYPSVRVKIDGGSAEVFADPVAVETAFRNLFDNAFSFSPSPGEIRVSLKTARSDIEICIEDDGPGIPPELLDHVFDRFATRRDDGGGTGLGLAISRAIVENAGGVIRAENVHNGGARFIVTLPTGLT